MIPNVTIAYLVEIFPYAQRARGIAIFQFFGKAAQFFGTNVNPIGFDGIGWQYLLFYCCWIAAETVMIYFLWPETSNRSLEELAFRKSLACPLWTYLYRLVCLTHLVVFEEDDRNLALSRAAEAKLHHDTTPSHLEELDEKGAVTTKEEV